MRYNRYNISISDYFSLLYLYIKHKHKIRAIYTIFLKLGEARILHKLIFYLTNILLFY